MVKQLGYDHWVTNILLFLAIPCYLHRRSKEMYQTTYQSPGRNIQQPDNTGQMVNLIFQKTDQVSNILFLRFQYVRGLLRCGSVLLTHTSTQINILLQKINIGNFSGLKCIICMNFMVEIFSIIIICMARISFHKYNLSSTYNIYIHIVHTIRLIVRFQLHNAFINYISNLEGIIQ